jgi:hypothetical protein
MSESKRATITVTDYDEQVAQYRQAVIEILEEYGLEELFTEMSNNEIRKEMKKIDKNQIISSKECGKMVAEITGFDVSRVIGRIHVDQLYEIFIQWRETINMCE